MTCVLDASAVLAMLLDEPGAAEVQEALLGACISAVNLAEVVSTLVNRGLSGAIAREAIAGIDITTIAADRDQAIDAGILRAFTAQAGLSLGDRFCLSLARRLRLPVLTADSAWRQVEAEVGVSVHLIR
ncbi:type II toxin-antitoxin system VapC family toxin [Sphingomonas sp.]|jgi:PIN domain nuclease of toxin-antitoxin system|uniref:type II toxin-antitoxin system VapC family toxin n=1 Tax=Sphingomonas sp. TaxID=28214 RepID=UPI002EDA6D1E